VRKYVIGVTIAAGLAAPAATQARVVTCPNARTHQGLLLHTVSARNVSCRKVHSILRKAMLPPTASSVLRWGSPTNDAPPGWQFDLKTSVFYTTVEDWVMANICGSMERFTSGSRAFRFTWGHTTRWVWHYQ
jgi:hypothetical protein